MWPCWRSYRQPTRLAYQATAWLRGAIWRGSAIDGVFGGDRAIKLPGVTPASTPAVSTRRAAEMRLAERRLAPRSPADLPLIWVIVAVAIGGVLAPAAAWLRPEWLLVLTLGPLAAWLIFRGRASDSLSATWLLATVAFLAAAWSGASWRLFNADDIGRYAALDAEPVCLEVVATAPPTHYPAEAPSPFRAIPSTDRTVVARAGREAP